MKIRGKGNGAFVFDSLCNNNIDDCRVDHISTIKRGSPKTWQEVMIFESCAYTR
ncbi:hypothetical protein M404DRAFT_1003696 [Pisolithus tinctorius Marx 270]|uniref:Uncharacterized protein n=1 Tax=Pisolithus tinctorius Marx 270 TaxID=870435 RepID=A0A0C3IUZ6_PISTI|nr:hypothetical protein M404DRAFT_1003696 [Pisolithus tinctorius Marx 270]